MNPIVITKNRCHKRPQSSLRNLAILAGAVSVLLGATPSCNATRGLGQDVEQTGESIQRAVRR